MFFFFLGGETLIGVTAVEPCSVSRGRGGRLMSLVPLLLCRNPATVPVSVDHRSKQLSGVCSGL